MGFTERASCRPYKNCYKNKMAGGKSRTAKNKRITKRSATKRSATKRSSTKRSESGNVNPSRKHIHHPAFVYHSEHTTYTSHPNDKKAYGKRTVVDVKKSSREITYPAYGSLFAKLSIYW
jgi:hypothetical protein